MSPERRGRPSDQNEQFLEKLLRSKFDPGTARAIDKEADIDRALADHDGFRIREDASVDIDAKIAGPKTGERAVHTALKLILRGARAERLPHGVGHEFLDA